MSDADPWTSVKDEVQQTLKETNDYYARWQVLVETPDAGGDDELEWTQKELLKNLKSIGWDIEEMEDAVGAMENNPGKFRITSSEVKSRQAFVSRTKAHVAKVTSNVTSSAAKAKVNAGKRAALLKGGGASSRYAKLEAQAQEANDDFIEDQSQKQELIMREQDTQLGEVSQTIGVLKNMGQAIGDELEDQNMLLDELDDGIESTSARLKRTVNKIDKVLAISKDGKQSCCICVLIIALIALIVVYMG